VVPPDRNWVVAARSGGWKVWHGPPARQRPPLLVDLSGELFMLSARSAAEFSSSSGCQVVLGLVWGPRLAGRGLYCRFVDRLTGVAAVGGSARSSRRGGLPGLSLSNCLAAAAERRYVRRPFGKWFLAWCFSGLWLLLRVPSFGVAGGGREVRLSVLAGVKVVANGQAKHSERRSEPGRRASRLRKWSVSSTARCGVASHASSW
jgi:hypothetical protein